MSDNHNNAHTAVNRNIDWDKVERAKRQMALVADPNSDEIHEYCQDLNHDEREAVGCCCGGGRVTDK